MGNLYYNKEINQNGIFVVFLTIPCINILD